MSTLSILVIVLYSVWAICSILSQSSSKLTVKMKSYDLLNILPSYKFFCPNPIRSDYHLYYRGRFHDDQLGEWKEISIGHKIPLLCAVWNPTKKERKVFYKIVKIIRKHYRNQAPRRYGHTYLLLLDFIKSREKENGFESIQFRITTKQDLNEGSKESVFYMSNFHKYETARVRS